MLLLASTVDRMKSLNERPERSHPAVMIGPHGWDTLKRHVRLRFGPPAGFAGWDITAIGNHTRAARADPDSESTLRRLTLPAKTKHREQDIREIGKFAVHFGPLHRRSGRADASL
jgi:hypothetical protein